jgi:hypothetical protein
MIETPIGPRAKGVTRGSRGTTTFTMRTAGRLLCRMAGTPCRKQSYVQPCRSSLPCTLATARQMICCLGPVHRPTSLFLTLKLAESNCRSGRANRGRLPTPLAADGSKAPNPRRIRLFMHSNVPPVRAPVQWGLSGKSAHPEQRVKCGRHPAHPTVRRLPPARVAEINPRRSSPGKQIWGSSSVHPA